MGTSAGFYRTALAQIRQLKRDMSESAPMFDFYEAILEAQSETSAQFEPDLDRLDIDVCQKRIAEGAPLLGPEDIKIDWSLFDRLFEHIWQICQRYGEDLKSADSFPAISGCSPEWHQDLLKGVIENKAVLDEAAKRAGISPEWLAFLASQTFTPFLETYAERLRESTDDSVWSRGYCPVCGGEPLMGKLEKETGKRLLQCHLCRTEWPFKRLECPFCGNADQNKLRFFADRGEPAHRVDVCDNCKMYIKIVDARKTEDETELFVEYIATAHLDIVAKGEGFHRDANRPPASQEG